MIQLFTRNLGWKLFSLLIAVALWVAVAREPEVATSFSVPVDFKNMRDDLDIERQPAGSRAPGGTRPIRHVSRATISPTVAVVLDLSDAHAGQRTYSIRGRNLNLPVGSSFLSGGSFATHPAFRLSSSSRKNPCSPST